MSLMANLLMSPTLKKTFVKVMNEYQLARLLWPTVQMAFSGLRQIHTLCEANVAREKRLPLKTAFQKMYGRGK